MAKTFQDLKIWQEAHSITLEIYRLAKNFPKEELYSLADQIKRSSGSVAANIAESFGRVGVADIRKFLCQARASLLETINHLILARDLEYIIDNDFQRLSNRLYGLEKGIASYSKHLKGLL